jgi:hypothetical protein
MNQRAGVKKDYYKHFHLDEAKLRKIAEILSEHAKKLTDVKTDLIYRVERCDERFYETSNIEDVLADDNSIGRQIECLKIRVQASQAGSVAEPANEANVVGNGNTLVQHIAIVGQHRTLATVTFRDITKGLREKPFDIAGACVQVEVEEKGRDWCFVLADDLDAQIERTLTVRALRRGYAYLDIMASLILLMVMIPLLFSVLSVRQLIPTDISGLSMNDKVTLLLERNLRTLFFLFFSFTIISFLVMTLRPISWTLTRLSHPCFHWGDMTEVCASRQARMTQIKWGLIAAFGIGVLSSIVAALIVR